MMLMQKYAGQPSRRARRQVTPSCASHRAGSWRSAARALVLDDTTRVANPGSAGFEGITMTTKRPTRHLAPRST
jgi:hypothetical protein